MSNHTVSSTAIAALENFDSLPDSAFVRVPVVAALFNCSRATIYRYVQKGKLPAPKMLSQRNAGWRVGDLRAVLGGAA